jgi:protein gp37
VFEDWQSNRGKPKEMTSHRGHQLFAANEGGWIERPMGQFDSRWQATTMNDVRSEVFRTIDQTPALDWLLLTKRPENVRRMWRGWVGATPDRQNVWLGTSAGCQATADKAIPHLLKCRDLAPVLFVSCEPMLDAVTFSEIGNTTAGITRPDGTNRPLLRYDALRGMEDPPYESYGKLNWLIIGCESNGPRVGRLGTFKSEAEWIAHAAKLVDQCRAAGVAVFVKQIPVNGRVEHDAAKFPAEVAFQELPQPPRTP